MSDDRLDWAWVDDLMEVDKCLRLVTRVIPMGDIKDLGRLVGNTPVFSDVLVGRAERMAGKVGLHALVETNLVHGMLAERRRQQRKEQESFSQPHGRPTPALDVETVSLEIAERLFIRGVGRTLEELVARIAPILTRHAASPLKEIPE